MNYSLTRSLTACPSCAGARPATAAGRRGRRQLVTYAAKQLHFNTNGEALKRMQAGVDKLASVVGVTLGPKVGVGWLARCALATLALRLQAAPAAPWPVGCLPWRLPRLPPLVAGARRAATWCWSPSTARPRL